jgi:hypothetical protein
VSGADAARLVCGVCSDGAPCCLFRQLQQPWPQPNPLPTQVASPVVPSRTASPSPSAEDLNLHKAELAVCRFWRVIDRLSADPDSDLTELTTVARGSVAAQWARNINQYRFDEVRAEGRVAVRDVVAKQPKDDDFYKVTACIDASKVNLVDKNGKSVVYSDNAVRAMKNSLAEVDFDRVWEAHHTVPHNKPDDRPRCDQPGCLDC